MEIVWDWPQAYQQFFEFKLQSTLDLTQPFQNAPSALQNQGPTLRLNPIALPAPALQFYRVGISLK